MKTYCEETHCQMWKGTLKELKKRQTEHDKQIKAEAYQQGATDMEKAKQIIIDNLREEIKLEADGCEGCAFITTEEWEMPCLKCKRNCKDYWRAKEQNNET